MKLYLFLLAALVALVCVQGDDKYTTKYDDVDVDAVLRNDRLLQHYANCLLDKGNCTPDAAELKKVLKDALETECSKCNDRQREASKKVVRYLIKNKRDIWNELQAKYDPENLYVKKYDKELKAEGIVL